MDLRLRLALSASVAWYEAVFASHGIGFRSADGIWSADGPAPAYHSALVTLEPGVTAAAVRSRIVDPAWGGLKDSFATIDGEELGMRLLFEAAWVHRPAAQAPAADASAWRPVHADALDAWNEHAGMGGVLLPGLLDRPELTVLERRVDGRRVAGAVLHALPDAVGLSNVHGVDGYRPDWGELGRAIGARHPGLPVVGFETGADLDDALTAGWEAVGPLRIWAA